MSATSKVIQRKIRKGAKYNMEFVQIAARLVAAGMTEKEVGFVLGVKPATIKQWKRRYEEFKAATDNKSSAKQIAVAHLVASGLQAAMGYDYEDVDQTMKRIPNLKWDADDPESEEWIFVIEKETRKTKHRPPDKDLLQFFLLNLTDEYRNTKSITIEETKKTLNLNITGHLESGDIRKLAGAAFKTADSMDKETKMVESKVVDVIDSEVSCGEKHKPPVMILDTRKVSSKLNDEFLESISDDDTK
jgi:predicted transcriptional regulator